MRVAGVFLRADDRRRVGDEPFFREPPDHRALHVDLGERAGRFRRDSRTNANARSLIR